MQLMKWNPWREFRDLDRLLSVRWPSLFDEEESLLGGRWSPAVDIEETDKELIFRSELPGFEKNEIDISVNDGRLTIAGERKFEKDEKKTYHRRERWYGRFERSFTLPRGVKVEKITAELKNGVLTLTLPKKEEARPRQIPVKVA